MIQHKEQKRVLGLGSATSTVVCAMIGAGIFMSTGLYAFELGSGIGILIVWAISGLLALCGSFCAIELASIWPEAGGSYVFIRNIFGRSMGFLAGFTMAFIGFTGSIAFVAGSFGAHMEEVLSLMPSQIYASLAVLIITGIHLVGVREGNAINVFGAVFKITLLLMFIIFGFSAESTAGEPIDDQGITNKSLYDQIVLYGAAIASTSFAYQGNMATSFVAGEILKPEKNLSRSMLLGVGIVTILYMFVNGVYLWGAKPYEMVGADGEGIKSIGFFVAERLFGKSIGFVANIMIMMVFFLTIGVSMMIGSRVIYSMAKRGELPQQIAKLNKGGSPYYALLLMCLLSLVLVWSTELRELLESVGTLVILTTGVAVLGVIVLRIQKPNINRPVKLPFFPLPPIVFLCLTFWIVWGVMSTNLTSVILIFGVLIVGLIVWFGFAKKHSIPVKDN
ncbi:MAG: amino acid permease [Verrucomicrobiota bacterium]|nr:amino acid permease [Verrucomicrobiota bacterium]